MLTDVTITDRADVLDGKPFGRVGAYEQIYGSATFEVDPADSRNARVVDLGLAPTNAAGRVECRADVWVLQPAEPQAGNGALLYHVVNRGRKGVLGTYNLAAGSNRPHAPGHFGDGFLMEEGWTVAACAWQADVPPEAPDNADLMTLDVPVPTDGGRPITGPVACEILVDAPCDLHSLGSRYHHPYEVAEGTESSASLTVRQRPYDTPEPVDRDAWSFDRLPDGRAAIRYPDGFEPGLIYNLVYTGRDPRVVGLGFVTTRDFVSAIRHDADLFGTAVDRTFAFGSSQSGRFLRHLVYEGFNEDEAGRQVFDGLVVNVAGGGLGSFNHRFAQPSRHASAHFDVGYPTEQFPFTDLPQTDPVTGQTAGLLDRCDATGTTPRIFYTNTSTEYWNRSASLTHTDITAARDVDVHPSVRIYHFAGTQHGPADLPAGDNSLPGNPVNFRLAHRALLVALGRWVRDDTPPPDSRHGRIDDGTLVPHDAIRRSWPAIGIPLPEHPRDPRRLDHGDTWPDGVISREPPVVGEAYPTLLPAIDDDGNEVAGVRLPEVAVPLGTFAGWRLRSESMGAPWAIVGLQGFWKSFDDVPSRYANEDDYAERCVSTARDLIDAGYLLDRDLPLVEDRARRMYRWAVSWSG